MTTPPILAHPVSVAEPPGSEIVIAPTHEERARLAEAYSLLSVDGFVAHVTVTARPAGALLVEGRVEADIVQACVVTLEPVRQHIDEAFSLRFVREAAAHTSRPGKDVYVDVSGDEPPDVITGATIDVGTIVEEHFALAIDPYPRAPGAAMPSEASDDDIGASPFAGLAGLIGEGDKKR